MKRWFLFAIAVAPFLVLPPLLLDSEIHARVISIASVCLLLWIFEVVPPFVPTLLLWALVPLFIGAFDKRFALPEVLSWAADPVMALFLGCFTIGVAAQRSGLSVSLTNAALRAARGSYFTFLFLIMLITAFASMWISNIAAAALVFATLQPILARFEEDHLLRRMLLVGVAFGADFGGIATPIGTGPNAIAMAAISDLHPISFLSWMMFAFPLSLGMLVLSFFLLSTRVRLQPAEWNLTAGAADGFDPDRNTIFPQKAFVAILSGTAVLWLTEPLHHLPASVVSLSAAAVLFGSRILSKKDLRSVDWSTLLLISGGITLGRLLEQSAIIRSALSSEFFSGLHPVLGLFLLCLASATLSALMSNTATVVLLIPIATALIPAPSTAILIAVSSSFGVPLLISTPPNAMAFGRGGVKFGDMFWPGILFMFTGCLLVALTGKHILGLAGIP